MTAWYCTSPLLCIYSDPVCVGGSISSDQGFNFFPPPHSLQMPHCLWFDFWQLLGLLIDKSKTVFFYQFFLAECLCFCCCFIEVPNCFAALLAIVLFALSSLLLKHFVLILMKLACSSAKNRRAHNVSSFSFQSVSGSEVGQTVVRRDKCEMVFPM